MTDLLSRMEAALAEGGWPGVLLSPDPVSRETMVFVPIAYAEQLDVVLAAIHRAWHICRGDMPRPDGCAACENGGRP